MFRNLLPKEYGFFDFFENHIALTIKLGEEVILTLQNPSDLNTAAKAIKSIESELDQIEVNCIEALHKTFITPIERTEIYKLIKRLDGIANSMNSALSRMNLYEVTTVRPEAIDLVNSIVTCCKELEAAIKLLRDMKNIDEIRKRCDNVRKMESQADKIFKSAIKNLFREADAVTIIKWKEIFDKIEKGVDKCQDAANIIEEIIIENA